MNMMTKKFDVPGADIAWCPGCGNFGILNIMKQVLSELEIEPSKLVYVSGIGQAAKFPQYINSNYFNGLHGRSLPAAMAIKAANPNLTVIAESGDGCSYGEGGNHFVHTILRNPNITNIVHDNMIYGLTKGQASPTSQIGLKTPLQVSGSKNTPINPVSLAISLEASFVARLYVGQKDHAVQIIKKAIQHEGYALIDMLHPCVTFNKINTYKWFKEHTYILDDTHDPSNREMALKKADETDKFPLGILYINEKPTFEKQNDGYKSFKEPLWKRKLQKEKLKELIESKRY